MNHRRRTCEPDPVEPVCRAPGTGDDASNAWAGEVLSSEAPVDPNAPMTMTEYLDAVERIEAHYRERDRDAYSSDTTVAAMRALYGYEGGFWEAMIPDATNEAAPSAEEVPEVESLFRHDESGGRAGTREVTLEDGSRIDPGHLYTGIDAVRHPDTHYALDLYGIENEDGATWSGDVGQAIILMNESREAARDQAGPYGAPAGGLTADEAMAEAAGESDLDADLDGVVLGHHFDASRSLTDQLASYYTDPNATTHVSRRTSEFLATQGMSGTRDGGVSEDAAATIREEVDDFAEAFSHRDSGDVAAGLGLLGSVVDEDAEESTAFTDRFIDYLNRGLRSEPE